MTDLEQLQARSNLQDFLLIKLFAWNFMSQPDMLDKFMAESMQRLQRRLQEAPPEQQELLRDVLGHAASLLDDFGNSVASEIRDLSTQVQGRSETKH